MVEVDMKTEIKNLMKVCLLTYVCLGYCYFISKIIPRGIRRLLAVLPVIFLFLSLPLHLKSVHFIGVLPLFVSWLANFKLLLFAFGTGPLSAPSITLSRFLALAVFPIKNPRKQDSRNPCDSHKSIFNYAAKGVIFAFLFRVYFLYMEELDPKIAWMALGWSLYLCLEVIGAMSSMGARFVLGLELEPMFNEPYLSSSLQDFWGRRWNLMVNRALHPTVYQPVHKVSSRFVGQMWASVPAILATFAVSGLMHEIIFFYFTRALPKWDVMFFFFLQGVCVVVEIAIKKAANDRWKLPRLLVAPLVVSFVLATAYQWFRPALLRGKMAERAFEEYRALGAFLNGVVVARFL